MQHERRGGPLSRRAVLRLMVAAAAAGPARAGAASAIRQSPIPSSGERIPTVGVGTWRTFDVGASAAERAPLKEVLRQFVGLGGRMVDSSPMYGAAESVVGDRKSTRLNSSHSQISYAVFCLKKKKIADATESHAESHLPRF